MRRRKHFIYRLLILRQKLSINPEPVEGLNAKAEGRVKVWVGGMIYLPIPSMLCPNNLIIPGSDVMLCLVLHFVNAIKGPNMRPTTDDLLPMR